jgi:hypothetical protein
MNAKDSVVRMKNRLAEVGFVVEVLEESDTKVTYSISNITNNIWETKETFFMGATKFASTNRWNKFLSYSRTSIGNHDYRSNITYSDMYSLVNSAIFSANVRNGKVAI